MVETWPPIGKHAKATAWIAGAGSEINRSRRVAVAPDRGQDALHVNGLGTSFQSVKHDEMQRIRDGGVQMVQHKLIAVGRLDRLATQLDHPPRPHESSPDRLNVRAGK